MNILYGVQGTGNGHVSRASAMAGALAAHPDIRVTWLLSSRRRELGCGAIEQFLWREGLTFRVERGKVKIGKTLSGLNLRQFFRDVSSLDLSGYDLLISDYEPVLCHAARKRGMPVLGIGHQYAFRYPVPQRGFNPLARRLMLAYAPVTQAVGLHWHHFGSPILPPILDLEIPADGPALLPRKVIVYLPFEEAVDLSALLRQIPGFDFYIYHPDVPNRDEGRLCYRAISRQGFKLDLLSADRVICNAGFELISECLRLGKRLLTFPVAGQMEQQANAEALEMLGYATVLETLEAEAIERWLHQAAPRVQVNYPDVAQALAAWIASGRQQPVATLAESLWRHVQGDAGMCEPNRPG